MSEREPDARVTTFLSRLEKLGAGDRARLKRDAGKTLNEAQSLGVFYRLLSGLPVKQEEIYFLVATLFPLAEGSKTGNLGTALHRARDPKPAMNKGLDRRIEILLDADLTQLPFRLRQTIRYLQSKRGKVNWQELLEDLLKWNWQNKPTQKKWARAYFAVPEKSDATQPALANDAEVA